MDDSVESFAQPRWFIRLLTVLVGATLLVASHSSRADEFRTVVGAGIGAAAGAIIGDSIGGPTGAVLGAGAGGLLGARVAQIPGGQRVSPPAPPPGAIYYPQQPVRMQPVPVIAQPVYLPYPGHRHRHHHHHHHMEQRQGPWWENGSEPPWQPGPPHGYGDYRR